MAKRNFSLISRARNLNRLLVNRKGTLSKEVLSAQKRLEDWISRASVRKRTVQTHRVPRSSGYFLPGSVLTFNYENQEVIVMCVSIKRSKRGTFISSQGNRLVPCIKVEDVSPGALRAILDEFYRKSSSASYASLTNGLNGLLSKDKFRTYNLTKMVNLHRLRLEG